MRATNGTTFTRIHWAGISFPQRQSLVTLSAAAAAAVVVCLSSAVVIGRQTIIYSCLNQPTNHSANYYLVCVFESANHSAHANTQTPRGLSPLAAAVCWRAQWLPNGLCTGLCSADGRLFGSQRRAGANIKLADGSSIARAHTHTWQPQWLAKKPAQLTGNDDHCVVLCCVVCVVLLACLLSERWASLDKRFWRSDRMTELPYLLRALVFDNRQSNELKTNSALVSSAVSLCVGFKGNCTQPKPTETA